MASDEPRVPRFALTERVLHWTHAAGFAAMLATGLVLYVPALAQLLADRPLVKAVHLTAACLWLTALALVAVLGDRRTLRRTRRQLERLTDDDLRWLLRRPAPQGRFNAGQKLHAVAQAALAVLFTVSGVLLYLGERNTALRLPGTIALHDAAMYAGTALVIGHVWMAAFAPTTRASLDGMLRGSVPAGWAAEHHAAWTPEMPAVAVRARSAGMGRLLAAGAVLAVGLAGVALVVTA